MNYQIDAQDIATKFFESYGQALLRRDTSSIADHYAVPALIEFPGNAIVVSDRTQTEAFFGEAFAQYAAVSKADAKVVVIAATNQSIWADVTWDHHGAAPDERNMYQLALRHHVWSIAVLTPLSN